MKRFLCLSLALIMMLCSFALVACDDKDDKAPIDSGEDNNDNNNTDDKKDEPTIPEGYKLYDNGNISFAYPDDWTITDGSTVLITAGAGNNITVVYEAKTNMYEDMTMDDFNEMFVPAYEAMGMTVSNASVNSTTNDNDVKITKISYKATASGVTMKQTLYITTAGQRTYTVTVTETTNDATLVKNVFDTLTIVK